MLFVNACTDDDRIRAMETAGKLVDNDELRDALKENGIGPFQSACSVSDVH